MNKQQLSWSILYESMVFVVMLLSSSGMEQDLHTNTSKYGMWYSTSSMYVLQERSLMIDHIKVILWDIQLLQDLFSTVNQIKMFSSTDPIMFGLMNLVLVYPYKTSTLQVIYSFENIPKLIFIIQTSSTPWFHINLILNPLHFVIKKWSHMKLSYLPMVRKLVLIHWMIKILQSHISLIQSQIHEPVISFQQRLK